MYKIQQFMAGRNGNDDFGKFLMVLYLGIAIINLFAKSIVLQVIDYIVFFLWIFRFFSRNRMARNKENQIYRRIIDRIGRFFKTVFSAISRFFQRLFHSTRIPKVKTVKTKTPKTKTEKPKKPTVDKDHVLRECPICKTTLKLRNIKGERLVLCSGCHNEVKIKI